MSAYEDLVTWCRDNGINRSRSADKYGYEVWARKGVSLTFSAAVSAVKAEALRVQASRDMSMLRRKPKTARARETAEKRSAANAKRLRDLEDRIALRNRELGGVRAVLSSREARAIVRQVEADEREVRHLRSLMTSVPQPNAHAGRPVAQHRS